MVAVPIFINMTTVPMANNQSGILFDLLILSFFYCVKGFSNCLTDSFIIPRTSFPSGAPRQLRQAQRGACATTPAQGRRLVALGMGTPFEYDAVPLPIECLTKSLAEHPRSIAEGTSETGGSDSTYATKPANPASRCFLLCMFICNQ